MAITDIEDHMKLIGVMFQLALTAIIFYSFITERTFVNGCWLVGAVVFDVVMLYSALKSSE